MYHTHMLLCHPFLSLSARGLVYRIYQPAQQVRLSGGAHEMRNEVVEELILI